MICFHISNNSTGLLHSEHPVELIHLLPAPISGKKSQGTWRSSPQSQLPPTSLICPGIGPVPQSPRRMGLHTPPRPRGQAGSLRVWASVMTSRIQMQVQPATSAASSPATTGQRTSQSKPAGDRSQVSARKVTATQVSLSLQARRLQPLCPSWSSEGAREPQHRHRRSVPPLWLRLSKAGILPVNHWCPQCERPLGRQPMAVDDIGSWWGAVRVDLQAVALSHE
ncbi:hypothetical protein QTO34_006242 [Cnephaeus nilssonii]|uniref:Uncharacterized protein n=1 Tax=Cnephaeus nilssonii TaxID=3371016 RepID=A0AA40LJB5_CNENI|nr:hypothetical protein QTO34_006242 [Eptesicus nilssonii]